MLDLALGTQVPDSLRERSLCVEHDEVLKQQAKRLLAGVVAGFADFFQGLGLAPWAARDGQTVKASR